MKRIILVLFLILIIMFSGCYPYTTISNNSTGTIIFSSSGIANRIPKYNSPSMLGISNVSDNGTQVSVNSTFYLEKVAYDDMQISLANARSPASLAPSWIAYKSSQVPEFSASQINVLYFSAQLPHSYKEGTDLEFHIHVAYPDNTWGYSRWYVTYSWANIGEVFPVASSSDIIHGSTNTTDEHQLIEVASTINGTGKKISSVLLCSIQRTGNHASDNYTNTIYLVSADFHYQKDTLGSATITSK